MSQCQHCVTSPQPPPSAAVRWTASWTLPYMIQMQNDEYDGPSHAFVKVNHSSWLYIQFNLQFMLSSIKTATPRMKIIISLFFLDSASRGRQLDDVAAVSGSANSKYPSCNRDIQEPCQSVHCYNCSHRALWQQARNRNFSQWTWDQCYCHKTHRRSGKPFHLFKLKNKNKSDSKESKFGDKHETRDNNPVNIHLQVSWFTLRAWMSHTIHTKCRYYFEEMCKLSFNKQCSHALWCWLLEKYTVRNICMYTSKRSTSTHAVWALADPFA